MRLVFLLTQSLDSPGGGGRYLPLAKALVRRGHAVTLIMLHPDWAATRERYGTIDGVAFEYVAQMHIWRRGGHKRYFPAWQLPWIALLATVRLAWAAWASRADALVVGKAQPMNALAAWLVHKGRGLPVYLDSDDWESLNNRFQGAWQQRIVGWFERWLASFATGISANTRFIVEQYEALGVPAARLRLVPNSVEPQRFAPLDRPELPATLAHLREQLAITPADLPIVYVGSLSLVNHALDLLLDAFAALLQEEPRALLLLVGGGEDADTLRQQAEALGIAARVRFVGRVPLDEVPAYYRLGLFSVAPMWDTPTARSSLSIKLAESLYAGVPCLTADVGDYGARVGAGGLAVTPGSVPAFTEGMRRLLHDPAQREAMQAAARATRDRYAWDGMVDTFLSLYPNEPPHA